MDYSKIVFLLFISVLLSAAVPSVRYKRSLVFNKGSRLFVRLNIRDDFFKYTQTFIHAVGYKMSWDLPDKVSNKGRPKRRDLYVGIETLLVQHHINGPACLKKFFCEAKFILNNKDFTSGLVKLLFTPDLDDKTHSFDDAYCGKEFNECPLSLISFM